MGSENQATEGSFRSEVTAEIVRGGLALLAVALLARTSLGSSSSPAAGVSVLIVVGCWFAAAIGAWMGRRAPLRAWHDCLAPAVLSLILAGRNQAGFAFGLGFVALGSAGVILASTLRGRLALPVRPASPAKDDTPTASAAVLPPDPAPQPAFAATPPPPMREILDNVRPIVPLPPVTLPSPSFQRDCQATEEGDTDPAAILIEDDPIAESWTRREHEGEVSIEAVVHARFAEGARQTTVHLPFIPPLPAVPTIETEPLESGSELDVAVESAYRHGARLSITRSVPGAAEEAPLGVVIYTSADEEVEFP